jgi:hypothetical protein
MGISYRNNTAVAVGFFVSIIGGKVNDNKGLSSY